MTEAPEEGAWLYATKARLSSFPVPQNGRKTEIVCGVGNVSLTKRKLVLVAVYMPPSIKGAELDRYIYTLVELMNAVKIKYDDPIIFVGGDFNGKDLSRLTTAFPELLPIRAGATRRGAFLDEVYTNAADHIVAKQVLKPLSRENGILSDHLIITASIKLPKQRKARAISFKFRLITADGVAKFEGLLNGFDWQLIGRESSSQSALALKETLDKMVEESFPLKERRIKSTDAPWFTPIARRAVKKKIRIYRKEGKSEKYHQVRLQCDRIILEEKKKFWAETLEKTAALRNSSPFFKTVKMFKSKESTPHGTLPTFSLNRVTKKFANWLPSFLTVSL